MDIAERNGLLLRRRLRSAERFKERAMLRGSVREKTPGSRSSALLFSVTCRDHCLALRIAIRTFQFVESFESAFSASRFTPLRRSFLVSRQPLLFPRTVWRCLQAKGHR